ncbi:hypothetical protein K504DRAFT_12636 [Pleomassaria siparia CBS 279.74]|uniref:Autophagy-related protein 27 n=1 Tax=Pleomassaria siparia CBS 279.74 TaxID=1314801 RepID=A0A6G1KRB3_9PLEO|nr:hypothetical protein K504DRAFT_12636 [Pleomassaria siparia CBS 279.74]
MRPHTSSSGSRPRPSSFLSLSTLASVLLVLPSLTSAAFDCGAIPAAKGVIFNLKSLDGPRRLHWLDEHENDGQALNYTFTLDICKTLLWDKGTDKTTNCKHGSRVCAIREDIDETGTVNNTIVPIEIAGTYSDGLPMNEKFQLLRDSKTHADAEREGFRAELHGGMFNKIPQQAIIEFLCDRNRTGLEGDELDDAKKDDDEKDGDNDKKKEDDDKDKKEGEKPGMSMNPSMSLTRRDNDDGCETSDASLRFCSYAVTEGEKGKKVRTLRLQWRTKYACEDTPSEGPGSSSWGFFTWFIIILFLATASYLIFGSWLNYNRYGARGWDLLPHGDTIRDVPYILKDFARRVTSTIQGSGSRGGYSAV